VHRGIYFSQGSIYCETGKSGALQTDHTTATLALEIAHPLTLLKMTLFGFLGKVATSDR